MRLHDWRKDIGPIEIELIPMRRSINMAGLEIRSRCETYKSLCIMGVIWSSEPMETGVRF